MYTAMFGYQYYGPNLSRVIRTNVTITRTGTYPVYYLHFTNTSTALLIKESELITILDAYIYHYVNYVYVTYQKRRDYNYISNSQSN